MASASGTHPTVTDQSDTNLEREGLEGATVKSTLELPPFTHDRHLSKGSDQTLGVYLTQDFIDSAGPLEVWTKAFLERPILQLVEQDQAEVVVSVNEQKNTVFTLTNRDSVKHGVQTLPTPYYGPIPPTVSRVIFILCALSRWHYYLRLTPDSRPFKHKIDLEFYKLRETDEYTDEGYPILEPDGPNLNKDGMVDIIATTENYYGIRVVNRSTRDLYVYIFDFSSTGLSINQMNSRIPGSDHQDPTLPRNTALTIGYGPASPLPFMFAIDEGVHHDVNIFKLLISTEQSDFDMIEQEDAFALTRESPPADDIRQFFGRRGIWDSFAMTIVQRLSPEGEGPSTNPPEGSTTTQPALISESTPVLKSTPAPETATATASSTSPESAPAVQPTSTPDPDSDAGPAQFTGGSEEPLVVKARSATETSNTWFRTPALTEEFLDSIRCMKLRTLAKQQGPAGATPTEQNGGYFEISVIGPDDLPKLTSPDAETTMTYRSHSAPSTSNHVWTDGVAFERDHELWSKLEVGDRIEVSVCASGRGWTNDAEQGELIFSPGD